MTRLDRVADFLWACAAVVVPAALVVMGVVAFLLAIEVLGS